MPVRLTHPRGGARLTIRQQVTMEPRPDGLGALTGPAHTAAAGLSTGELGRMEPSSSTKGCVLYMCWEHSPLRPPCQRTVSAERRPAPRSPGPALRAPRRGRRGRGQATAEGHGRPGRLSLATRGQRADGQPLPLRGDSSLFVKLLLAVHSEG